MHEVITISVGQRANHTATQFFNCQQELLYLPNERLNDPSIFLNPTIDKFSKTVSYTPRLLLWDAKNGNGALGTYQYSQSQDYYFDQEGGSAENHKLLVTHPPIPKSDYQVALDSGAATLPKLTNANTKYWSDYSKLIYAPNSFNYLKDWHHDVSNPNIPDFENLKAKKFDSYDLGAQEFNENDLIEFFDCNLHSELEQCDTLQGFNIITDMDSGWGGFTAAMIQELKNELPKKLIFNWGFHEDDPLTAEDTKLREPRFTSSRLRLVEDKIKSMAYMSEDCDLIMPLYANSKLSNWEQAGLACKLIDTISSVLCISHVEQRKSMDFMRDALTLSDTSRNVVTSMLDEQGIDYSYFSLVMPFKNHPKSSREQHIFSECSIIRGNHKAELESAPNKSEIKTFAYHPSDTIPPKYSNEKDFKLDFATTESGRNVFMHYQNIVTKYMRNTSDREELKDRLASMASQYEYSWYEDENSSNDDF